MRAIPVSAFSFQSSPSLLKSPNKARVQSKNLDTCFCRVVVNQIYIVGNELFQLYLESGKLFGNLFPSFCTCIGLYDIPVHASVGQHNGMQTSVFQ